MHLAAKKAYQRWRNACKDDLRDVVYIRGFKGNHRVSVAFAFNKAGEGFKGEAVLNPNDQWNKKLGHSIAVGRALKRVATSALPWDLLRYGYSDKELDTLCRAYLNRDGYQV